MRVSREGNLVTLINVFETQPKLQQTLIEQWMRFAEEVKEEPGFIGAALHRSTDGTRVINYAQWRSEEDFESGCRRSTASKWTPVARSPSASIPIFTKSSISLSGKAVDCLSASAGWREHGCPHLFPRVSSRWRAGRAKRSKDRMAKPYRVNAFVRINNTMISSLLRLGIKVWSFSLLTVRGRKSGKPIVTPVAIFVQDQKRYLVATYGVVNWVRNLRAAGGEAALTWRRHSEKIHAIELEPEAAAPIFREALRSGPPGIPAVIFRVYRSLLVLPYLNVTENSSLEEFEREVLAHPVFLLQPAM